ncbi:MAG: hypothetical protein QOI55_1815 [Actinomycetota bacterium]|nr:hypothetical protein [Actinomycetota bacterium]
MADPGRRDDGGPLHVLYLIDSLIAGGGAERSLAALAPHYRRLGVRLDVAYLHERPGVRGELEAASAEVFPLTDARHLPAATRRAAELIRARRPDLVHTTLFEADIVGRVASTFARTPVVSSLVNAAYGPEQLDNPALKAWKVRGAQLLDAATARRVRRFHAVSSSVAEVMAARLRVPRDRIDVIPRGRDPRQLGERSEARRVAARAAVGAGDRDRVVLAVGRHEYQKGYDVLLRAFAGVKEAHPNATLLIAGRETTTTPALRALADSLGHHSSVRFLGVREDVGELLCAADVFAFPSRWEGMPGGVLEAMALETPIVASDIGPVREVLGDPPLGCLVPVDDVEALSRAIRLALHEPIDAARTAAARARFLERFTIDAVAEEMVRFYARAISPARQ